jgi:hypothetical protein
MAWDDRYRMLTEGEVIRATDEVERDNPYGWKPPHPATVGTFAPNPHFTSHRRYRRLDTHTSVVRTQDPRGCDTGRKVTPVFDSEEIQDEEPSDA